MKMRNFTPESTRARDGRFAIDRLLADADEKPYFPHAHVPILDVDFLDDESFEPDGVNDFARHLEYEEMVQQ